MPRQVLTIIFVALGFLLLMQMCRPKETLPPAVATEKVPKGGDDESFLLSREGLAVELAADGSVISARRDGKEIVQRVAPWRRPFQVAVRLRSEVKRPVPAGGWKSEAIEGGREFTYTEGDFTIRKAVKLAEDGGGLELELGMTGAIEQMAGAELTGASAVRLSKGEGDGESYLFRRLSADKLRFSSFLDLVQERETRRARHLQRLRDDENVPKRPQYYRRTVLDPGQTVERLGILGADHYLLLEAPQAAVRAVNADAYRIQREGEEAAEENQIETWVSLDLSNGSLKGSFRLRWGPRSDIGKVEPPLDDHVAAKPARTHRIENDTLRLELTERGGAIRAMWLKRFSLHAGEEPAESNWIPILRDAVPVRNRAFSLRADPATYGAKLDQEIWEAIPGEDGKSFLFQLETPAGFRFTKVIRLPEEGRYDLQLTIRVRPPEGWDKSHVQYTLIGPAGSYIEDSYRGIIGAAPPTGLLLERRGGEDDDKFLEKIEKDEEPLVHSYSKSHSRGLLRAIGVRGAYFVCALITEERVDAEGRPAGHVTEALVNKIQLTDPVERPDGESSRLSLRGQIACSVPLQDGEAAADYRLYGGPTRLDDLRPLKIEDAVNFGFFGVIGRFLMWLMKALQSLFGSYGAAIIAMTLIVRACLLPVSYRTQLGMMRYSKRIQKIKPLLDELEKKHGNNRQKLNQERMKIMREHKVGFPLGCLMIFFQIPIWFALFQALRVEFSLRHQAFLWAEDLSMPDRLFELPFWPHHFNLLPILMLVLWVTQQKLAPQPGGDDPQVQMQMKMVKFMPYMFFIFLYKYAAALSVYMCVSSGWSILESKFVRKAIHRTE